MKNFSSANQRVWNKIINIIENKRKYDLPIYLIDLKKIQENYKIFQEYFPDYPIHYALKSNSNLEILKSLHKINANFEIASVGELNRLLSIGVNPKKIIFSNPCKSLSDIKELHSKRIRYFAFENVEDLKRLQKSAPNSRYALRIKLPGHDKKFTNYGYGATIKYIKEISVKYPSLCKKISGLTFYGSHELGLSICRKIMRSYLKNIKFINLGGAFLYKGLVDELDSGRKSGKFDFFSDKLMNLKEKYDVDFILEPGAAIINNACHGISKVKYVNSNNDDYIYYHIDLGPTLGLRKEIKCVYFYSIDKKKRTTKPAFIVDSTCAKNYISALNAGTQLSEGDFLIFPNVGMYSIMYINDFHLLKKPKFIYIK